MPPKDPKKKINSQNLSNETTLQNSASNSVKLQQKSLKQEETIHIK